MHLLVTCITVTMDITVTHLAAVFGFTKDIASNMVNSIKTCFKKIDHTFISPTFIQMGDASALDLEPSDNRFVDTWPKDE